MPGSGPTHLEHPALLYRGAEDFLEAMLPYVEAGIDREEVVFVAARGDLVAALEEALGERAGKARLEDTDRWYPHPSTRLRAFHELVTAELAAGARAFRLAGEPVWPAGPPELIREWQRYESVLNSVLQPYPATLVCLYDAGRLDPSILEGARRTHPLVRRGGLDQPSGAFLPPEDFLRQWNPPLEPPPARAAFLPELRQPSEGRRFAEREALRAGVSPDRAADLAVAVNEVVTNSILYGERLLGVWAWPEETRFVCQVEDAGPGIADPLAGYRPPGNGPAGGRGLWLARQMVDLLQLVPTPRGTAVRLYVPLG